MTPIGLTTKHICLIPNLVHLMKENIIVGVGRIMPQFEGIHNHKLMNGWVVVSIEALFQENIMSWEDYPTHSEEIESGSFSAWPKSQLKRFFEDSELGKRMLSLSR